MILTCFIVNTGAGKSVIKRGFFDTYLRGKIQLKLYKEQTFAVNKQSINILSQCSLQIQLENLVKNCQFIIILEIEQKILFGTKTLTKWRAIINLRGKVIYFQIVKFLLK
jgi:hypothetical protein